MYALFCEEIRGEVRLRCYHHYKDELEFIAHEKMGNLMWWRAWIVNFWEIQNYDDPDLKILSDITISHLRGELPEEELCEWGIELQCSWDGTES